jgi:UTP--glucose-1-phosphate uridylyltransferase
MRETVMPQVKKAIIPAAGLGTRFLPATKTVPKEMLTIVDAPIIFYVVEEAVNAGIEEIILIQGRGKTAIEDFFDTSYELEDILLKTGKTELLERVRRIRRMANIVSIRQKEPRGLGHAVLCAKTVIGDASFAVLLGDEIMVPRNGEPNTTAQLCRLHGDLKYSVVAIMEVDKSQVSKYGIADVKNHNDGYYEVNGFVEKPKLDKAPSRFALPGRYVFTPRIFAELEKIEKDQEVKFPGLLTVKPEIQLTDAMNSLAKKERFYASTFSAQRFDAGDKLGYLQANVELGLMNPELHEDFKKYLIEVAKRLEMEKR